MMGFQKGRKKTGGRKKGTPNKYSMAGLQRTYMNDKDRDENMSFVDWLAELFYKDDKVLIAVINYMISDAK